MIIATVELEGIAPYSQSKNYTTPKKERELPKDYEERTWRDRLHVNAARRVLAIELIKRGGFVRLLDMEPEEGVNGVDDFLGKNGPTAFAKFLSVQVPGKGKATYTKNFEAGILVTEGPVLPLKKEDVQGEWLFLPSDGKRGSGTRVWKCYPLITQWKVVVVFYIVDELITKEVFLAHLQRAGELIGLGRFRPRNNGFYGRFKVNNVDWQEA